MITPFSTAKKNPEDIVASEYGMSRLLREVFDLREGSTGVILQRLLHASRLHLGMDVAFISEFEGEQRIFRYVDESEKIHLLKVGQGDPLEASYCQRVVDGRLPELIRDAQMIEEALKLPVTKELGVGAHLSTPIRLRDGAVFGTFCCFSFHADHTLNERDQALMHVFAELAAELIEQGLAQAQAEELCRTRIGGVLTDGGLSMVWQPVVELASGRIVGVEALSRFPLGICAGPHEWFADAASVGLGEELEFCAAESGLAVLALLKPDQYVAVNASTEAILRGKIVDLLARMPLHQVVLEITEHEVIKDYAILSDALAPLRRKGMRLAIDDAGAGYASFRHILCLRPDIIKLDISLTHNIDSDVVRRSLAVSLVRFAQEIGCRLVAEGVETRCELDILVELGAHAAQGFFLYRPQSRVELANLLSRDSPELEAVSR